MFETSKIKCYIEKFSYKGYEESESSNNRMDRDSDVELTLRIPLQGEVLEELERRYFPGVREMINLTIDKSRHYKLSLKLNKFGSRSIVFFDDYEKVSFSHKEVSLVNPVQLIAKEGQGDLFVRVGFVYSESLDNLKAMDGILVFMSLFLPQSDLFEDFEEEELQQGVNEAQEENPDLFEVSEEEDDLVKQGIIPPLNPLASRTPTSKDQVDCRTAEYRGQKGIETLLDGLLEIDKHNIKQRAAEYAFTRYEEEGKVGSILSVQLKDVREAKKSFAL